MARRVPSTCCAPITRTRAADAVVVSVRVGVSSEPLFEHAPLTATMHNAPQVREALSDASAEHPARIVVDLSEVEFVDSTALGVLIEARTRFDNQRAFLLAAPALGLIAQQSQRKISNHLVLEISPDVVWVENLEPLPKNVWYTWRHSRSPFMNFQALQKAYSSM